MPQCIKCLCAVPEDETTNHVCPTSKKQYMVNYSINFIHTIWIDADSPEEAEAEFEILYDNDNGILPEESDIDHTVDDIIEVPRRFVGLNTWAKS